MPDYEVRTGVDDHARPPDYIAARLSVVFLLGKRQMGNIPAFCAAVERHDDDVMRFCELRHGLFRQRVVQQHVRVLRHGISEHGDLEAVYFEAGEITLASRVMDACVGERLHRRVAALLPEVARMVVGQAHHVEARVREIPRVSGRRSEQVARLGVAAFLGRLAAVHEHAFEVAEGDVRR